MNGAKQNSPSNANTRSLIIYTGLDELCAKEIRQSGWVRDDDLSSQEVRRRAPNAFSAYLVNHQQTGDVSAQDIKNNTPDITAVTVENGGIVTSSEAGSSLNSLTNGSNTGNISAQGFCSTCQRKVTVYSSWNYLCVAYLAGVWGGTIIACGACVVTSGWLVPACGVCLTEIGVSLGSLSEDVAGCDVGHDCHQEWRCVSEENEDNFCGCPNIKVTCREVHRDA